jgi:hypothetical protein
MSKEKSDDYCLHTLRIIKHVRETYGDLQVCKLAEVLIHTSKSNQPVNCLHKNQTIHFSRGCHESICDDCGEYQ